MAESTEEMTAVGRTYAVASDGDGAGVSTSVQNQLALLEVRGREFDELVDQFYQTLGHHLRPGFDHVEGVAVSKPEAQINSSAHDRLACINDQFHTVENRLRSLLGRLDV